GAGAAAGPGVPAALPRGRAFLLGNDPGQVIIVQSAEVHECIEDLLRELRAAMKVQVKVDVRFLSISDDFMREVGFNWPDVTLHGKNFDETGELIGFNLSSRTYGGFVPWAQLEDTVLPFGFGHPWIVPDPAVPEEKGALTPMAPFIGTGIPFFGEPTSGLTFDFGWGSDKFNLSGLFRLGEERDEIKTLSSPSITLANGQLGFITVETDYDYISTYSVDDGVLVPEIDSVSETVNLSVRPIVSADRRYVFLELSPTVQTVTWQTPASFTTFVGQPGGEGGAAGASVDNTVVLPATRSQFLETTVGVPDRGVLVVGGLGSSTRTHSEGGVPILSKIPILKRIFSAEGRKVERTTLFVLAKPQIIILGEEEKRMR
ncbi:MAG: hypothetical protein KAX19_10950, partial [Candidatus Brocadiae bacterium]|nr:hypothetical protein [Candidatus Brocadiia bacterium]